MDTNLVLERDLAAGVVSAENTMERRESVAVTAEMIIRAYVRGDVLDHTAPTDYDGLLSVEGLVDDVVATFGVDATSARGLVDGVLDELTDRWADNYIAAMD